MALLQLKDPLKLFVKRREFLPRSGFLSCCNMTSQVEIAGDICNISQTVSWWTSKYDKCILLHIDAPHSVSDACASM